MNIPISKPPNYTEIIHGILSVINGPIGVKDLAEFILQVHPSNAKNPHQAALVKIRENQGRLLVFIDDNHVLPLRLAYQDARFRIRLNRANIDQSALPLNECFHHYLPFNFRGTDISFIDYLGNPILFKVQEAPHTITFSPEEQVEYHEPVLVFKEWFHSQRMYVKDHILVTIKNWEKGIFQLERERFGEQHLDLLSESNRYVADEMYKMLESAKYEDVDVQIVLPTIFARMPNKGGYPPDHWKVIVENDPRMATEGWSIRYPESGFDLLGGIFTDSPQQSLISTGQALSKEEAKVIYRFHAALKHKPSIWRDIEIKGKQTLADLDYILRVAFQHDTSDHLSGFWKRIARTGGSRKRYREVDIGTVNPFEYAEGSYTAIAALKLAVGDQVKYVYDFGDWIEHTLELQSIYEMEKGVHYPRETARNKPKYEYCTDCLKKGKKTVATWICYTCSNEEQQDIMLCEKCLEQHEEHDADELIY